MSEVIKIEKTIYGLNGFNNIVNTAFSQLAKPDTNVVNNDLTVSEFFNQYDALFFEIPPSGSNESHLELATRSLEYLGISLSNLQIEIDNLREENIELKNQILLMSQIDTGTQV